MIMPEDVFYRICKIYCQDEDFIEILWKEIMDHYSSPGRYYHSLNHIIQFLKELEPFLKDIKEADAFLFAAFYHDLIYNPLSGSNEEESAGVAELRLSKLNVPQRSIDACKKFILATKDHFLNANEDINYFTDADLSILGKDDEIYTGYAQLIRKEYAMLPDEIYKPARKRILQHFLNMDRIYKTEIFYKKYEKPARQNIKKELLDLQ
jgi:predicted metal-dependent HD superfamily phosphohydrolase